jgi:cell division protein ZipA
MSLALSMTSQLRWALLGLGVLAILALIIWERRRPRQASGGLERPHPREAAEPSPRVAREPLLNLPEMRAREPLAPRTLPAVEVPAELPAVPVLTPAAQAAATPAGDEEIIGPADEFEAEEFESAPLESGEFEAGEFEAQDEQGMPEGAPTVIGAEEVEASAPTVLPREVLPELPAGPPPLVEWPPDNERRILALRLVAPVPDKFAGRSLRQALAAEGFVLGQFAIFHKPDEERRAVLSAASLTRPGTFDMETMDSQHYGGLSLFAVLPGPKPARQAFDDLVFAARNLNDRLHGVLQDEQGTPLTPSRIAFMRDALRTGTAA